MDSPATPDTTEEGKEAEADRQEEEKEEEEGGTPGMVTSSGHSNHAR